MSLSFVLPTNVDLDNDDNVRHIVMQMKKAARAKSLQKTTLNDKTYLRKPGDEHSMIRSRLQISFPNKYDYSNSTNTNQPHSERRRVESRSDKASPNRSRETKETPMNMNEVLQARGWCYVRNHSCKKCLSPMMKSPSSLSRYKKCVNLNCDLYLLSMDMYSSDENYDKEESKIENEPLATSTNNDIQVGHSIQINYCNPSHNDDVSELSEVTVYDMMDKEEYVSIEDAHAKVETTMTEMVNESNLKYDRMRRKINDLQIHESKFALERQKTFSTDRECSFHRKDANYASSKLRHRISHRNSSFDRKSRSFQRYKFDERLQHKDKSRFEDVLKKIKNVKVILNESIQ